MKAHHQNLQAVSALKVETDCPIRDPWPSHHGYRFKQSGNSMWCDHSHRLHRQGEPWAAIWVRAAPKRDGESRRMGTTWKRVSSGQKETDLSWGKNRQTSNEKRQAAQEDSRGENANQNHTESITIGKNVWHSLKPNGLRNNWRGTLIPEDNGS